jgi:pyruvate,water dikinase
VKLSKLEENTREARKAVDDIVSMVIERKGPLHARVVSWMLTQIRELTGQREAPKFHLVRALAVFRRMFQKAGAEMVAEGSLAERDDIFFLRFQDIESGGDLRKTARANRETHERHMRIRSVPRFITDEGECIYGPTEKSAGGGIEGVSVSRGVYEGRVRVIEDPRGARLGRGEVLVTHSTDPSWTPLFLNAGALVMESGGTGSHGGIVAREYGIPAVSGIEGVTTRLKTGQMVRVNGDTGEIFILEGEIDERSFVSGS